MTLPLLMPPHFLNIFPYVDQPFVFPFLICLCMFSAPFPFGVCVCVCLIDLESVFYMF